MLDAFIIDKIRRERQPRDGERIPLRIDVPPDGPYERNSGQRDYHDEREDDREDRGVVIIDFTV